MKSWSEDALFYHIYPLGFCGAPARNDYSSPPVPRLEKIISWLDHLEWLGVNALYLGPVFESRKHGYDTADYFQVDRRLGTRETLAQLSAALHGRGFRLILDGVFNHVGRDFWAFRDVLANGINSPYCSWFQGLAFGGRSPFGDPFTYAAWEGHYDLVKLNLQNPEVREHLFSAVAEWVKLYDLDWLRLDVASELDLDFLRALSQLCRGLRPDFWLMGEVIHGDYRRWANPDLLDSVTNYEGYKSLYSSHLEANYFELAYALNRQFGPGGLYTGLPLYNFADNHDVNRVASQLRQPAQLYPLYCLLFTIPGVPSLYYGSEWGLEGRREAYSDSVLRPCLDLEQVSRNSPHRDLAGTIAALARIRRESRPLRWGSYQQLHVSHQQFAFLRQWEGESAAILVNSADAPLEVELPVPLGDGTWLEDRLNLGDAVEIKGGRLRTTLLPTWGRVYHTSSAGAQ